MRLLATLLLTLVLLSPGACGEASDPRTSARTAPAASRAIGTWSIDRAGLGRVLDEAIARLQADMAQKLESVSEADRDVARNVGVFAVEALSALRDLSLTFDVKPDGSFTLAGVDPVSRAEESGTGTWIDRDGTVAFTVTWKNGAKLVESPPPMRFSWKDENTLEMNVARFDVGIPLNRTSR